MRSGSTFLTLMMAEYSLLCSFSYHTCVPAVNILFVASGLMFCYLVVLDILFIPWVFVLLVLVFFCSVYTPV